MMLRRVAGFALAGALALVLTGGCGGDSSSDGSGGSGGCGSPPGNVDCLGCNNEFVPIECVNGVWQCPQIKCAPDAGTDAGSDASSCPSGEVPTVDGCITCADATQKLSDAIEAARAANDDCSTPADCVMTSSSTTCAGSCGVAVSTAGEAAFQSALSQINADYCSAFVPECGFSTPKCANATLVCNAGSCEATYN